MAINTSDLSGGGGGEKPFLDLGTVTGTQTLDLASYSAFKVTQGAGNLTLDFNTSDPELRGDADFFLESNDSFAVTVNNATLTDLSLNTGSGSIEDITESTTIGVEGIPATGVFFNNDGTKMFLLENNPATVYQYTLTSAFLLSTASYDSVSFDASTEAGDAQGLAFNDDGTKMYISSTNIGEFVYEYDLSTGFDLSTASYSGSSFDASSQNGALKDVKFNSDGTKMYLLGDDPDEINQYSLSTAFDITTATFDSVTLTNVPSFPGGFCFNNDGSIIYVTGSSSSDIDQFNLATPYDLSSATLVATGSLTSQADESVAVSNDGSVLIVTGNAAIQYNFTYRVNKISQFGDFIGIQSEAYPYAV